MSSHFLVVSFIVHFLKNYTIKKELGSQKVRKFGLTMLIEDNRNHLLRVAKIIDKKSKKNTETELLKQESLFNFDSVSLPQVIEYNETKEHAFLILDYKPGITIDVYWDQLKRKERHKFLIKFLTKLCSILEILKKQDIVHCDIKPSNIIIHETENDFEVYLIDFGLALKSTDTNRRKLLFPLGYAAPELLLNHLDLVDHRTDIFSLGILIWRLYVGHLPLTHSNPSIYTNLQLTHPIPAHSRIPKETFKILQKMSAKHSFNLPPNRMGNSQVKIKLEEGKSKRYQDISAVLVSFLEVKLYLFQRISRR